MSTTEVAIVLRNVDWELLRAQKEALAGLAMNERRILTVDECMCLEGILGVLDALQDQAAEVLGEECVFGASPPEGR